MKSVRRRSDRDIQPMSEQIRSLGRFTCAVVMVAVTATEWWRQDGGEGIARPNAIFLLGVNLSP